MYRRSLSKQILRWPPLKILAFPIKMCDDSLSVLCYVTSAVPNHLPVSVLLFWSSALCSTCLKQLNLENAIVTRSVHSAHHESVNTYTTVLRCLLASSETKILIWQIRYLFLDYFWGLVLWFLILWSHLPNFFFFVFLSSFFWCVVCLAHDMNQAVTTTTKSNEYAGTQIMIKINN